MQRLNNKKTYSEIYEILNILGEDYINKVPKKLYNLINSQRDLDYKPHLLKENGILDESLISRETIALFAVLNVKYFMEDDKEKQSFMKILKDNETKYQAELYEKYNPHNIFKKSEIEVAQQLESVSLVEYKEPLLKKIINKLKNIWKREH